MTEFYTSIEQHGNHILYRGYKNGKAVQEKIAFKPSLYMKTKDENQATHYSLIGNVPLRAKKFDSIREMRDFAEKYKDVEGIKIYGTTNASLQFTQERFPVKIDFDPKLINLFQFDIEVNISGNPVIPDDHDVLYRVDGIEQTDLLSVVRARVDLPDIEVREGKDWIKFLESQYAEYEDAGYPDVEIADREITAISIKSSKQDDYYLLSLKDYDKSKTITGIDPKNIKFYKMESEEELLRMFIKIWQMEYPDLVTGWNVEFFDIQYIVTRIINLLGMEYAKRLSPWGIIRKNTITKFGRSQSTYHISGMTVVDYMDSFKKFGFKYGPQPSYKLDHIAHVVLDEKKLSYEEYGSLGRLWIENPQLYNDYALKDTKLVQRMEEEAALIGLVQTMAYKAGAQYADTLGTVSIWETLLYRRLMDENIVPDVKRGPDRSEDGSIVGGYVKEPIPGMYKWVVSIDATSLYPSIMAGLNMSPETIDRDNIENISVNMVLNGKFRRSDDTHSVAANGARYSNEKDGIIPQIIREFAAERTLIKKEMLANQQKVEDAKSEGIDYSDFQTLSIQLNNAQNALKVLQNSLYGATASIYFLYYILLMAESITTTGQLVIKTAEKTINSYLNKVLKTKDVDYVIAIDTDSAYINMEEIVRSVYGTVDVDRNEAEEMLTRFVRERLEPVLDKAYKEFSETLNVKENRFKLKLEKISDRFVITGKKRYLANVISSEGVKYKEPKISVTGIEAVRSSTPDICREKMEEAFKIVMTSTEDKAQEFVSKFQEDFKKLPAEEIARNSSANDLGKYSDTENIYKKGCPQHIRGALLHNAKLKELGIESTAEKIVSGDKIKVLYLKMPNPLRENVISFSDILPKEFGLQSYIDYDTQFEKVFLKPLDSVLGAIGWTSNKITTLEDFFT